MQMRFWFPILLMLGLVCSASCSLGSKRKIEIAVEQSVNKFHDRLNQQQYHEIYSESDPELHKRVTEVEFKAQLVSVHDQMGTVTDKARVYVDGGVWRSFRRAFSWSETVNHGNLAISQEVVARERFAWAVENDLPRLVSYEWTKVCTKPCTVQFGELVFRFE